VIHYVRFFQRSPLIFFSRPPRWRKPPLRPVYHLMVPPPSQTHRGKQRRRFCLSGFPSLGFFEKFFSPLWSHRSWSPIRFSPPDPCGSFARPTPLVALSTGVFCGRRRPQGIHVYWSPGGATLPASILTSCCEIVILDFAVVLGCLAFTMHFF